MKNTHVTFDIYSQNKRKQPGRFTGGGLTAQSYVNQNLLVLKKSEKKMKFIAALNHLKKLF